MPRKFKFCLQCRRTIAENEVQRGLFVQTPQGMLCATCAQQLDEETEAAKKLAAAHSTVLRSALSEVERAAQAPVPAELPATAVEEQRAPVPPAASAGKPAEPLKKEPARTSPFPQVSVREAPPAKAPTPAAPDPRAAPAGPPTPPAGTPLAGPPSGGSEQPAQLLDGIRQHLEAIHRTLVFEKSSPWNVLATVSQCLAVGMLILAAVNWADNPTQLLLVALIFQVMALTFYVRGK